VHQRVELNAMTSEQFVAFIERKLAEHGIEKIVPPKQALDEAYELFDRGRRLEEAYERAKADVDIADDISAPVDIERRVGEILKQRPTLRWDAAVRQVLEADDDDDGREEDP
jgi:hypothetical protein